LFRKALENYDDDIDNDFKKLKSLNNEEDPFYQKPETKIIGRAFYLLEGLANMIDNPCDIPITSMENKIIGQISMNIVPCEEDGNEELDEELLSDDPYDLVGQTLDFKVKIDKVSFLEQNKF
jgi:hypothetical protein